MHTQLYNIKIVPKTLYKYRDFNNDFHLRSLFEAELYMSSPNKFNDIYDCKIPIRFDLVDDNYLKEQLLRYMQQNDTRTPEQNQSLIDLLIDSDFFGSAKKFPPSELYKALHLAISGIFCLTSKNDNLLMWAHYAKNHTGFCIGYDSEYLLNINAYFLGKIEYLKICPIILPSFVDEENVKKQVFTKSLDWKYEQEYRIFYKSIKDRLVPIDKEAITKVYLGAKMDRHSKNMLIESINKYLKHVKIYEGNVHDDKFKLKFKRV